MDSSDIRLHTTDNTLFVVVMAVFLLVVGAGMTMYGYGEYESQTETLEEAVEVDIEFVDADVYPRRAGSSDDFGTDDEVEYRLVVEFEYEYEGETYTSSNFDVIGTTSRDYDTRRAAERAYDSYRDDGTAYVHPDEPGEAFLEGSVPAQTYILTGFGVFLFVGAFWMVGFHAYRKMRGRDG